MTHEVTHEDSFECAIRLIKNKYNPVVLDFASGTNPGGGWRGKQNGTQEESLCRRSNLGLELEKKKYPIPDGSSHYIKNIKINKDVNLININPVNCAVVASELKSISERTDQYLETRVDNWYKIAKDNNHNAIILGAIGCGAFKESDDDCKKLANIMKKCADKHKEIKTVFAMYKMKANYKIFAEVMV